MADKDQFTGIRLLIDNAPEVAPRSEDPPPEDPAQEGGGGGGRPPIELNEFGLPKGCPVIPLGIEGRVFHYLDAARQLASLKATEHQRLGVQGLFGRSIDKLYEFWPRLDKDGGIVGWRPERAAEELMKAAARRGVWSAFERVRGVGAWRGDGGELLLHCGDAIWQGPPPGEKGEGVWHKPGLIGRYVYPADKEAPRFAKVYAPGGDGSSAAELLELLETWNFRRKKIDARLLLGWIGAAMIGGALAWRPLVWLTGDQGTGKSSLQTLLARIFDDALISVSDASAAGIWQKLGHRTLPVCLDELEAEEDNRRNSNLVKLARQASSGGIVLRGGADHQGSEFVARSPFLFSGINVPPLPPQDRSRLAILEMDPLAGGSAPTLDRDHLRQLGAMLRRRMVDGWPRLEQTLERYRQALMKVGHNSRGADQFGALLAAADVLLLDTLPDDEDSRAELEELVSHLAADKISETGDNASDAERCLAHILTQIIDPYRNGQRHTIAEWIHQAADIPLPEGGDGLAPDPKEANRILGTYGVKVDRDGDRLWLLAANYHNGLASLYAASRWAGRADTLGGWVASWRRVRGAEWPNKTEYFAGHRSKATRVPLEVALPGIGGLKPRAADQPITGLGGLADRPAPQP